MRTIEKVHVFRCVGKVNGKVLYRINVVAGGHRHAERTCQLRMLMQVARLAMRGHGDMRTHHLVHALEFLARRMAGNVHRPVE